jgi:hypothetical protein
MGVSYCHVVPPSPRWHFEGEDVILNKRGDYLFDIGWLEERSANRDPNLAPFTYSSLCSANFDRILHRVGPAFRVWLTRRGTHMTLGDAR